MSEERFKMYNSFRGQSKSKFGSSHKRSVSIKPETFFKWTGGNMYRTSYNDMSNRVRRN